MAGKTKKLHLDKGKIEEARALAKAIADEVQEMINRHTTVTIERTTLRFLGVRGVTSEGEPLVNSVVDGMSEHLGEGVASRFLTAMIRENLQDVNQLAERISEENWASLSLDSVEPEKIATLSERLLKPQFERIETMRSIREERIQKEARNERPLLYVIVATGNIHEDVIQAKMAAKEGADVIAVIRATAQSLLDYVPYGLTTEGFGGTWATQENFELMREALDEVGLELGRYIRLVNYASGLCMPEISFMGAVERLDMMLNDSMYGILFRDINMRRTFCDQHFSRMINAFAGVTINTGEDNYLTTADAIESAHTVLASDFINEQFAFNSGLSAEMMGLGHAYEIKPEIENSLLLELANAMMIREIFPSHPLKYMPPTKHMTGDIFRTYLTNALFNLVGQWTNQGIQLLGMLTEAIHTPYLQDRYLAIENAKLVMNAVKSLGDEVTFKEGGFIKSRAETVLNDTLKLLQQVSDIGLMEAIDGAMFADISRTSEGGKGLSGVAPKTDDYYNPVLELFKDKLDAVIE